MRARGIRLRREYTAEAMKYEIGKKEDAEKDFKKITGRPYQDSPKLFTEIFDAAGERYPRTDKGNPSFRADALKEIKTPTASLINRVRFFEKRISSFYTTFLHRADANNIIHADADAGGTVTGRFAYRSPNLQQLSKEDSEEDKYNKYHIRGCFEPRDGNAFVPIDYRQQEYKLFMDYAREEKVIASIMDGEDVHQTVADMLGVSRKKAKNISFALLYGAGNEKLALMLDVSLKEAVYMRELYYARLPNVKRFMEKVKEVANSRGYIKNKYGRILHFRRGESYKSVNHLIQSTGADTLKYAFTRIYKENKLDYFPVIALIHDELLTELKPEHMELAEKYAEVMADIYKGFSDIKLTASIEHSFTSLAVWDMKEGLAC
jgi:DNA polymerase-1